MSNNNDSTKLTIIYTGNELLHIKNGFNFYGLLAVPNATVKFTGNGKDDFRVTGTVFANSMICFWRECSICSNQSNRYHKS